MPRVWLDDEFHSHPKVIAAGLDAAGLFARALSYCGAYLTDGFVPGEWVDIVSVKHKKAAARLTEVGLWKPVKGGFEIPDYLDYNDSKQRVLEYRAERVRAGQKGARRRWGGGKNAKPLFEDDDESHSSSHSASHGSSDSSTHGVAIGNADSKAMARDRAATTNTSKTPPAPQGGLRRIPKKELRRFTGCRAVRGSHGSSYVADPLGQDRPPPDWPHEPPAEIEVIAAQARAEHNGAVDLDAAVSSLAQHFTADQIELALAIWSVDDDERIRLADVAADLRRAS